MPAVTKPEPLPLPHLSEQALWLEVQQEAQTNGSLLAGIVTSAPRWLVSPPGPLASAVQQGPRLGPPPARHLPLH